MPTKRPPAEPASMEDYRAWKSRCGALLERQGISAGVMREKEWRKLFIQGYASGEGFAGCVPFRARRLRMQRGTLRSLTTTRARRSERTRKR
jgi:hypothetical protein